MIWVVFYPRTRSTVTMQLLDAMGHAVVRHPNNPDWEPQETGAGYKIKGAHPKSAIKVSAPEFFRSEIDPADKIIFCLRPPAAVEDSMARKGLNVPAARLNYMLIGQEFKRLADTLPNPIFILDTDALIATPAPVIARLKTFLGVSDAVDHSTLIKPAITKTAALAEPDDPAAQIHTHLKGRAS